VIGGRLVHRLLGGSAVLLVTANVANVGHFAFHVVMARMLGPAGYSALAAMIALVSVGYVLTEAAQTVMARYTALARGLGEVRSLVAGGLRHGGRVAAALAAAYLLLAIALAPLLRVPYSVMALFALSFASLPLIPVTRGALLGLHRFGGFGFAMLAEVAVKLGIGVAAVKVGWGEMGAAGAVGLSLVAAFTSGFIPLRDLRRVPAEPAAAGDALAYGVPVLAITATVMAFYNVDVLLARALFPPAVAGQYAVASLLGKGILLGVMPIARVMFPHASGRDVDAATRRRVLVATLGLLAACLAPALALVAILPERIVRLAGGPGYEAAAGIALAVTAGMALMAFSNTLLLFRLSQGAPRGWAALPLLLLLEAAVLWASRGALVSYALAMLFANVGFLVASIGLFLQPPSRAGELAAQRRFPAA
jgi:O-antigen/teichoic acid export membrane protein